MPTGDIAFDIGANTRPILKALSDLKQKVKYVFKGADAGELTTALKGVQSEIKQLESTSNKAQKAVDALMSGETTPKSIIALEKELAKADKELDKMSKGYDKMLAEVDKYSSFAGMSPKVFPEAQKYNDAVAALERYEREMDALETKGDQLRSTLAELKQNPELTEEAQKYNQIISETGERIAELKDKESDLNEELKRTKALGENSTTSLADGFLKLEKRIMGLAKRVFFFSVITKGLRALKSSLSSVISTDEVFANSIAQIKGNFATAFGMIWTTVLPALRAFISWIAKATQYIVAFVSWLTGKSFKQGADAMQAISDNAASTASNTGGIGKAAAKAAKKLQRMLMPFDQMNILSKDAADSGSGGSGGGGGAAGAATGLTWPTENDAVIAKFEKFKDLILLIGAAFAAWKLAPIVSNLLKISKIKAFTGLALIITGVTLLASGIKDLIENGPNVENVCNIIAGGLMVVAGVLLLLGGSTGLAIVLAVLGGLVLIFKNLYKNNEKFRKSIDKIIGKFKEFGERLKKAFDEKGFKGVIEELGKIGGKIFNALWDWFKQTKIGKTIIKIYERLKKAFKKDGIKGVLKVVGQIGLWILKGLLKGILKGLKSIGSWIKKNIFNPIIKKIKKVFGISSPAEKMKPIGENILKGILEGIIDALKNIKDWVSEHVFGPIKEALFGSGEDGEKEGLVVKIGTKFNDTKESIKEKWDTLTSNVKEKWGDVKARVATKAEDLKNSWASLTKPVDNKDADMTATVATDARTFKSGWTSLTNPVQDDDAEMTATVTTPKETLKKAWTTVTSVVGPKIGKMKASVTSTKKKLKEKWDNVVSVVGPKTADMKARVATKWADLKKKWEELKGHFSDITRDFSLKFSIAAEDLKRWININVIAKINTKFSKIPILKNHQIPYLASGAVIPANKEFLAVLGDQKRGVNIETPLSTMIDAFNQALAANGLNGASTVNVYLQGDAKQLFRVVRTEANNYIQSTGKAAFNL